MLNCSIFDETAFSWSPKHEDAKRHQKTPKMHKILIVEMDKFAVLTSKSCKIHRIKIMQGNSRTFVVLYGRKNQGKTTALMELIMELVRREGADDKFIANFKSRFLRRNHNRAFSDARIIVEYRNVLIFIGTGGDSWEWCRINTDFFECRISGKMDVYYINRNGIKKLDNADENTLRILKEKQVMVISACRPESDGNGAPKALHSYMEKTMLDYSRQIWLRMSIENGEQQSTLVKNTVKELLDIIDNIIQ